MASTFQISCGMDILNAPRDDRQLPEVTDED
jgi:hypothetical protein